MAIKKSIGITALTFALATALVGCGEKAEADKTATQVAARVNDDEITVHQINFEMAKLNGKINQGQAKEAADRILNSLIDQHLLMQQAMDEKVDRDPQVVQALEASRQQILAQAYIQRLTEQAAKPTAAEIDDYYAKNPALFAERRIFRLQEISIPVTPENAASIKKQLARLGNIRELGEWLKSVNIPARSVQSVKAAEQIPLELLPKLHALKDNQGVTIASPDSVNILFVVSSQSQPIAKEQAVPVIERFLANAKKREIAQAEIKKLRESAKLEYLGDYAGADKDAAPASAQSANPVLPAPASGDLIAGSPSAAAE